MKFDGDSELEVCLLQRAQTGDREAWGALVEQYRDRLKLLVSVRMDRRVKQRLDESDVIQEMYLRLNHSAKLNGCALADESETGSLMQSDSIPPNGSPPLTAYLWLRRVAIWTLADIQRKHLSVQQRDPRREIPLGALKGASSFDLAYLLLGSDPQPLEAIIRDERIVELQRALDQLEPLDREIIMLRHGEKLSRTEAALLLNISIAAAAKRYLRALKRVRSMMKEWES